MISDKNHSNKLLSIFVMQNADSSMIYKLQSDELLNANDLIGLIDLISKCQEIKYL